MSLPAGLVCSSHHGLAILCGQDPFYFFSFFFFFNKASVHHSFKIKVVLLTKNLFTSGHAGWNFPKCRGFISSGEEPGESGRQNLCAPLAVHRRPVVRSNVQRCLNSCQRQSGGKQKKSFSLRKALAAIFRSSYVVKLPLTSDKNVSFAATVASCLPSLSSSGAFKGP